jgi:hypothetical protein
LLVVPFLAGEGVVVIVVPGGDMAWLKVPPIDGRDLGVRATIDLLLDNGRGFEVACTFCTWDRGCFLTVEAGRTLENTLLGVVTELVVTAALTLLFPGAVMDPREPDGANLLGVLGSAWGVPSLVIGLPLDSAEAGLRGGGMELSALKKLDLRLVLLTAGEEGNCDKLSTVLSESEGRDFLGACMVGSASSSSGNGYSGSFSRNPARELACEDALDAERNASRSPSTSSPDDVFDVLVEGGIAVVVWWDGGRPMGFLEE